MSKKDFFSSLKAAATMRKAGVTSPSVAASDPRKPDWMKPT